MYIQVPDIHLLLWWKWKFQYFQKTFFSLLQLLKLEIKNTPNNDIFVELKKKKFDKENWYRQKLEIDGESFSERFNERIKVA